MRIIIFGASGLIGQGVLRECVLDPQITHIRLVGRSRLNGSSYLASNKVEQTIVHDLFDENLIHDDALQGYDACFMCLGTPVREMFNEQQYARLTYELTTALAFRVARLNPSIILTYVSGSGTQTGANSGAAWVRIKGKTEATLLALPIKQAVMFRPLIVIPTNGEVARNGLYRLAFAITLPLLPILKPWLASRMVTTVQMGQAMLHIAKFGGTKSVMESVDIAQF